MKDKIVIQNISKSYNKKPVLSDISIEVSQGESIGLFGPNGAGKTTLFSLYTLEHNLVLVIYLKNLLFLEV